MEHNGNGRGEYINSLRAKVTLIGDSMDATFIDRQDSRECLLAAFCVQEHAVFVGPPGTGKSLLSDALMLCIDGEYVRRLLHKFMVADELIGPMDLAAFQLQKVYKRVLARGACAAVGLFLDEIFKANAALLNTTLTLLNERTYADGSGTINVPLRMCVAASNEFPQDEILGALYDRFLFRDCVSYIAERRDRELLWDDARLRDNKFVPPCKISLQEWDDIKASALAVTVEVSAQKAFFDFYDTLVADGMVMSDRRIRQCKKAIRASAWLDGETVATVDHLQILRFVAWNTPDERGKVLVALKTLERSSTREALDTIDKALRAFHGMPAEPSARRAVFAEVLQGLMDAGELVKARDSAGEFSKRGKAKIYRRLAELKQAKEEIVSQVRL